jgi:glycine/D-amino acid oxidase-like deaminating enzyme
MDGQTDKAKKNEMTSRFPHIVVIGGGVIGTSIAWHLAKKSARVTLIEAHDLASGSSGACDGLVFMQSKKPGIHLHLALESLKRFHALKKALPVDIEFRQTGGRVIIQTPAQYPAMEKFVREQQEIGLDVCLMDAKQTLAAEPFLSADIYGSTWSALDAQVNPIHLTLGFALGAQKNHARIMTRTNVLKIHTRNNRVTGVATTNGDIAADVVINAAGARAGRICQMVGMDLPIIPRRGQIVVTQAVRRMIFSCMISAGYIAVKYDPSLAGEQGEGMSMEQTDNGNLLLGSTREFEGFCTQNTLSGIRRIISRTTAVLPALKHLQVIRTFAGLRPHTPDGLPILGPVPSLEGFFMAAGHEGDGIALSPITGELLADMILEKKPAISLDAFFPERFETQKVQVHG